MLSISNTNPNRSQVNLINNEQKHHNLFEKLNQLNTPTSDLHPNNFESILKQRKNSTSVSSSSFQRQKTHEEIIKEIKYNPRKKELYNAALQFESFFTEKMFRAMQKNIPENSLIPKNSEEKIFEEMLTTERVSQIHKTQNLGLADLIYSQLNVQV